jgi:hypothetical protein
LIFGTLFNFPLQASGICNKSGTCMLVRHAQMRAMN